MHPHGILLVRLILGAIWVAAGTSKLVMRGSAEQAVSAFGLLPERLAMLVGRALPLVELALGILILVGKWVSVAAGLSIVLLSLFSVVVAISLARGLEIECNCFGQLTRSRISGATLLRNLVTISVAVVIVTSPSDYLTVDGWLAGTALRPHDPPLVEFVPVILMAVATVIVWLLATAVWKLAEMIAKAEDGPALSLPERIHLRRWIRYAAEDPAVANNGK